jgi:outer membrane lipoprotein-sorting protein
VLKRLRDGAPVPSTILADAAANATGTPGAGPARKSFAFGIAPWRQYDVARASVFENRQRLTGNEFALPKERSDPQYKGGVAMRWLSACSVLILAAPAFSQQNEAEKLYRAMEKNIREAKSVKMAFEIDAIMDKETGTMRGAVTVAPGNMVRLEAKGSVSAKEREITVIADGKQALRYETGMPKAEIKPVESNLSETRPQILARGGVFATFQIGPATERFDIDKIMPLSAFKLGNKEKVGQREAQVVECTMMPDNGQVVQLTTWLDTKTNLPLKRLVTAPAEKGLFRVLEVYTEITLNTKFDAKLFELPK